MVAYSGRLEHSVCRYNGLSLVPVRELRLEISTIFFVKIM
jgi:hypothetical protein